MECQSPNCSPDWLWLWETLDSGWSISVSKINHHGFRHVLEDAQFIGRLLVWLLSKVTIKNHLGGGCWGRFLLRLSLSNIILRRGGVSRPSSPAGQIWLRVRCEVLHKTRVRTYDVCDIPPVSDTALLSLHPLSTMSSHLESHRSLCSINHKSDLILKSFRESRCWCHRDHWWHVTLWS